MLLSVFVYSGAVLGFVALVAALRPRRWLGFRTRRRALFGVATAFLLVATGLFWPPALQEPTPRLTRLDQFVPMYQFSEYHETSVRASPEVVFQSIRAVTAGEIRFFRALTSIRRFGRPGPPSLLNPPPAQPILDVAIASGFRVLADDAPREIVLGTLVVIPPSGLPPGFDLAAYASLRLPGFAKAAMNFHVSPGAPGITHLSTETRVFATDPTAERQFRTYWRLIYPGSAIIRTSWLAAVRRRAEGR